MQNGMLPVVIPQEQCYELAKDAELGLDLEVDLEKQEIRRTNGKPPIPFVVDAFRRHCLLNGLDDIALTLQRAEAIEEFEQKRTELWPWLNGFGYQGKKVLAAPIKSSTAKKNDW